MSGIDPKRTDVVTVDTNVKLRPDLAVVGLDAPATARPGVPVTIVATVHELNGDVGARADCVLRADGVQIDQIPNIWVDAGGAVSCMFAHAFSTVGMVRIAVSLNNVAPGDYDLSNNSATGQIEVLNPATPFRFYSASLLEFDHLTVQETWTSTRYEKKQWSGWSNSTMFSGEAGLMNLESLTASIQYETDDVLIDGFYFDARTNLPGRMVGGLPCRASRIVDYWFQVCEKRFGTVRTGSSVVANRNAGSITYHSEGWDKNMAGLNGAPYYTWNQTDPPVVTGNQTRIASTYRMRIRIEDGQATYEAAPQFQLRPYRQEFTFISPQQCTTNIYSSTLCTRTYLLVTGIQGTASGQN